MRTRQNADAHGSTWSRQKRPEQYRERVLSVVRDRELPLSLSELATAIANQTAPLSPLSTRRDVGADRIRLRLHHVDLPKLDDQGEIEYDASNNVVAAPFELESE